jgi:hypothetical protein
MNSDEEKDRKEYFEGMRVVFESMLEERVFGNAERVFREIFGRGWDEDNSRKRESLVKNLPRVHINHENSCSCKNFEEYKFLIAYTTNENGKVVLDEVVDYAYTKKEIRDSYREMCKYLDRGDIPKPSLLIKIKKGEYKILEEIFDKKEKDRKIDN